jgi:hypothetical protein
VALDQLGDLVAAGTAALRALDAQHVELAVEIAEDEICAGYVSASETVGGALRPSRLAIS